jgi:ribosome silencing factor RsfS/YbeB/iojap
MCGQSRRDTRDARHTMTRCASGAASRFIATTTSTSSSPSPSRRWTRGRATGVVVRAPSTRARAVEAADDEETQDALARKMAIDFAVVADDTRAVEVRVLSVSKSVFYARYVVLATAFNRPQMNACCAKMRDLANDEYGLTVPKSAAQQGDWACLDCVDVVVHVFSPNSRLNYDLDGLYKGAEDVELPFVTETRDEPAYFDEEDEDEEDEELDEFEVFQ